MPKRFNRNQLLIYIEKVKTLPEEYRQIMRNWPDLQKSPYSRSFYSDRSKTWKYTPDGCERISDHWNFLGKSKRGLTKERHCRTNRPVTNGSHWAHAIYSKSDGLWHVVSTVSKSGKPTD